ncbi:MAG: diacylglycerol kinase family protein [bacterium]
MENPREEDKGAGEMSAAKTGAVPAGGQAEGVADMLVHVFMSFYHAFDGMIHAVFTQRNMRFHFLAALMVFTFSLAFSFSWTAKAFLFMVVTFVISMEVLNTCIEAFTDMATGEYHRLAKVTKDTAAAAVLVVSLGSLMAAGYLFLPPVVGLAADPSELARMANRLGAAAAAAGSVFVFWFACAFPPAKAAAMVLLPGVSAFGGAFLCVAERDWIAFCAIVFFSYFLFSALAGRKANAYVFAGQVAGSILFAAWKWLY